MLLKLNSHRHNKIPKKEEIRIFKSTKSSFVLSECRHAVIDSDVMTVVVR